MTPTEIRIEVYELTCQHLSPAEIAAKLRISPACCLGHLIDLAASKLLVECPDGVYRQRNDVTSGAVGHQGPRTMTTARSRKQPHRSSS